MRGPVENAARAADLAAHTLAEWWGVPVMEKGNGAAGYILPGRDGGPMGEGTPSQAMARAMDRAGLVDEDGEALASFHGLRHSFVTNAPRAGLPLLVVSRVAGHADPSITAKVYARVIGDDHLDEVADAFDRMAEEAREVAE
ncbi:MAG: tyrosine-type recombinase/integrase [Miltoncostaeaceae bacterium]